MFTGIIRDLAPIVEKREEEGILKYALSLKEEFLEGLELGASLSVDGVCQTVVAIEGQLVWLDAIGETLKRTTLNQLQIGQQVNVERAARFGDEIGGHLLSGHIFGTAKLASIDTDYYTFACQPEWTKFLFEKGYIAVDGVSLTIASVDRKKGLFSVGLIPETLKRTTLGIKKIGEAVNLEFDALTQAAVETVQHMRF